MTSFKSGGRYWHLGQLVHLKHEYGEIDYGSVRISTVVDCMAEINLIGPAHLVIGVPERIFPEPTLAVEFLMHGDAPMGMHTYLFSQEEGTESYRAGGVTLTPLGLEGNFA